jgi:hypothetical protein
MRRRGAAARTGLVVLATCLGAVCGGSATSASARAGGDRAAEALALLADVLHRHDGAVAAEFDPQLAERLDAPQLAAGLAAFEAQFGSYRGHGSPTTVVLGSETVVRVPLRMSRQPGEFRLAFDADGRVGGIYFLRTGVPL